MISLFSGRGLFVFLIEPSRIGKEKSPDFNFFNLNGPPPNLSNWKYSIQLFFDDIDIDECPSLATAGPIPFSEDHANQIMKFVKNLPSQVDTLYIHCAAGVSRSGAIAKFLVEFFRLNSSQDTKGYNKYIYRILSGHLK